jgi:hypothetical protein
MWFYWQLGDSVSFVVDIGDGYLYSVVVGYLTRFMYSDSWLYPNCVASVGSKVMCGYS